MAGGRRHRPPALALGPSYWRGLTVDWLHDRLRGLPAVDENRLVTATVELVDLPRPRSGPGRHA